MESPVLDVLSNKHCTECPLSNSKEHIAVRNQTVKINSEHFPKGAIELLLVAESPPMAFAEDHSSYFYAQGKIKRRGLAYHTMHALFGRKFASKQEFLSEFAEKYYLLDMAKCPINRLGKKDKRKALASCAKYLDEELRALGFRQAVFIGKTSFRAVKDYLDLKSLRFNVASLPFGSGKNIENFRKGLGEVLTIP
jgi:hypothetical protein